MAIIPKSDEIVDVVPLSTLVSMAAALEARNEAQRVALDEATRVIVAFVEAAIIFSDVHSLFYCNTCDYWCNHGNASKEKIAHRDDCPVEAAYAWIEKRAKDGQL